jgi:hypothetical protein
MRIAKVGRPRSAAARARYVSKPDPFASRVLTGVTREREQLGDFPKHPNINLTPEEPYLRLFPPEFTLRCVTAASNSSYEVQDSYSDFEAYGPESLHSKPAKSKPYVRLILP